MSLNNEDRYADIIDMPHYVSKVRKPMPRADRAAQFSPFAALTGHDAAIKEVARITQDYIELADDEKEILNQRLLLLIEMIDKQPQVSITYFKRDEKKKGGKYVEITGIIKKYRKYERIIEFVNGESILIDSIFAIEGEIFR